MSVKGRDKQLIPTGKEALKMSSYVPSIESQSAANKHDDIFNRNEFSGGFKSSGYLPPKQSSASEPIQGNANTEMKAMRDLGLLPPEDSENPNLNVNRTKAILSKELMTSIENEVGKLKMHAETINTRKIIEEKKAKENIEIEKDLEGENRHVLYGSPERIQVLEHKLNPENITMEELLTLKQQNAEKLKILEEQYLKEKDHAANPKKSTYQSRGTKWSDVRGDNYSIPPAMTKSSFVSVSRSPISIRHEDYKPMSPNFDTKGTFHHFMDSAPSGYKSVELLRKSESVKNIPNPQRTEFESKLKKYLEGKKKNCQFSNALKKKSIDWDKYTKGPESPTAKGEQLRMKKIKYWGQETEKCPFSSFDAKDRCDDANESKVSDDATSGMKPQEKSLFLFTKKLVKNAGEEDALVKSSIVEAIKKSKEINSYLNIKNIDNLCAQLMNLSSRSTITWEEYIDFILPFRKPMHQIPIKKIEKSKSEAVLKPMMLKQTRPHAFMDEDEYASDPEIKSNTNKNKSSKYRPKSSKPRKAEKWTDETLSTKKLTGMDYQKRLKKIESGKYKCTIPAPFSFNEREKSTTIRQMKLSEMQWEKEIEENNLIHHVFKANPVPLAVSVPRYNALMDANQKRREEVRIKSKEITKSKEKPFSFYEKDIKRREDKKRVSEQRIKEMAMIPTFKANPIPWTSSVKDMWKEMKEIEDKEREQRINKRKQEILELSKLPPRMEMHKKFKELNPKKVHNEEKFVYKAKEVPDFRKLQETFSQKLEEKKKEKATTIPQEPKFHEIKKSSKPIDFLNEEGLTKQRHEAIKADMMRRVMNSLQKPAINPKTTAKTTAMFERRRQELEIKRSQEEAKIKEDQERIKKQNELKERVQHSHAIVDNSKALKIERQNQVKSRQEATKQKELEYHKGLEVMKEKVRNKPLLMEQNPKNKLKNLDKMNALRKVDQILDKAKIKDKGKILNKEEQDQVADANYINEHLAKNK